MTTTRIFGLLNLKVKIANDDAETALQKLRKGEIAALARNRGWTITGLQVERGRLDDVFREITTAPPSR